MKQEDGKTQVQRPALSLTGCVTLDNALPLLDLGVLTYETGRIATLTACCGPGSARPSTPRPMCSAILSKFFALHPPWFCRLKNVGYVPIGF